MTEVPDVVELGAEDEARRLWNVAERAWAEAEKDLVALCESLDFGIRAAEILVVDKLQRVRADFPATVGIQLETPEPGVDVQRDAITVPNSLTFTSIVDLLSDERLDCVSPSLHRGWEDRRFSCRRSRVTAQEALGVTLSDVQRDQLLLLAAYRNRIFRSPPPVRVVRGEILEAFTALRDLVGRLA